MAGYVASLGLAASRPVPPAPYSWLASRLAAHHLDNALADQGPTILVWHKNLIARVVPTGAQK